MLIKTKFEKMLFEITILFLSFDVIITILFYQKCLKFTDLEILQSDYYSGVVLHRITYKNNSLSRESIRRVDHSVDLFKQGIIKNIICVGSSNPQSTYRGSKKIKQHILSRGIPDAKVFNDSLSYSSFRNLEEALKIINKHD